jgi:hypothetical protein
MLGRDVIEDEWAMEFHKETGCWLKLGEADDFRRSEERRAVLRLLAQSGDAMTPAEVAKALGRRPGAGMRMMMQRMRRDGEIQQLPNQKYYLLKI